MLRKPACHYLQNVTGKWRTNSSEAKSWLTKKQFVRHFFDSPLKMKNNFNIVIFFLFLNGLAFGQLIDSRKHFTLKDTVFVSNTFYISKIHFDLAKPTLRDESKPTLDSIVTFMQKNKNIIIEVGCHLSMCKPTASQHLTLKRAYNIVKYLVDKGVNLTRLIAKGYECAVPIISAEKISKLKTEKEIEEAYFLNQRVDFKIIAK